MLDYCCKSIVFALYFFIRYKRKINYQLFIGLVPVDVFWPHYQGWEFESLCVCHGIDASKVCLDILIEGGICSHNTSRDSKRIKMAKKKKVY